MRSQPSAADLELLDELNVDDRRASAFQLERWRQRGLLPRAAVQRLGRGQGTQVLRHGAEVREAAAILASTSTRGALWQRTGSILFAHGLPLRQDALRACAVWLGAGVEEKMRRAWREASSASSTPVGAAERLDDVALAAADRFIVRRSCRQTWSHFLRMTGEALPTASAKDVRYYAKLSLSMRIADAVGAGPLTADQLEAARFFSNREDSRLSRLPLMSERQRCAETLTTAEAYLFRDRLAVLEVDLGFQAALDVVVWNVAGERLEIEPQPGRPPRVDRPLPRSFLEEFEADTTDLAEQGAPADDERSDGEPGLERAVKDAPEGDGLGSV